MSEATTKKPNIVFITVDQMRGDCLGIAGGEHAAETPFLDNMAARGILFERAYSCVPSCIAARASIFTGLSADHHGRTGYQDRVPWRYDVTLPGEFTKAGYQTQAVGKLHVWPDRHLMGFQNVILHDGYLHTNRFRETTTHNDSWFETDDYIQFLRREAGHTADLQDHGVDCNGWTVHPWTLPERLHPTNWVVSESIDFLRRRDPQRPFFLWMSFVRPHSPLDPPQYYLDMYMDKVQDIPDLDDWQDDLEGANAPSYDPTCSRGRIHKDTLRRARAAYLGLITHIDHQIGRFLQILAEYGQMQNTIFLFTSDHGDMLGDHHLFRKSVPYEESTHIPMLLYDPGNCLGIAHGQRCGELVELRDILPTLLDCAKLPIPENLDGRSMLPLITDATAARYPYLHGEHSGDPVIANHFIVTKTDKYIWYTQSGIEQYFQLAEDPGEHHNRIHDPACQERISQLRAALIRELSGREEGFVQDGRLIPGRPYPTVRSFVDTSPYTKA